MNDRKTWSRHPRPHRSASGRIRPGVEGLEPRALMSYAGSPDFTFGQYGTVSTPNPSAQSAFLPYATTLQLDGKFLEAGLD